MSENPLKVGEVARLTALSVRTLHHYDQIGLLTPARHTSSGHRLYGAAELARLQQIRSLKQLGFSLDEIRALLDDPAHSLGETVRLHGARLDEHILGLTDLRARLRRLEDLLARGEAPLDTLLRTLEATTMSEKYFTPEQLEQLAARREAVGEERIESVQNRWADLARRVSEAMTGGLGPSSEDAKALAREWRDLTRETMAGFTGGDEGLTQSVGRMWSSEPGMGEEWGLGAEVRDFMGQATAGLDD